MGEKFSAPSSSPYEPLPVSVLMPVFNTRRFLDQAIRSILGQTHEAFELICVNDGSTDGSLEIIEHYAQIDRRVIVLDRPNTGLVGALNDGLAVARGKYIARIDADDIALPHRLQIQIRAMESDPSLVAMGCHYRYIDEEDQIIRTMTPPTDHEEIDRTHLRGEKGCVIPHPAMMLRTAAVRHIGGYSQRFPTAEDLDLCLRLAEIGQLANLPQILAMLRLRITSISRTRTAQQIRDTDGAVREAWRRRGQPVPEWYFMPEPLSEYSAAGYHGLWARWALEEGNYRTARHHGLIMLRKNPFRPAHVRTFVRVMMGPLGDPVARWLRGRRRSPSLAHAR